jgi:hypothetical protein
MRIVLAAATLLLAVPVTVSTHQPAGAASYAWCAIYSGRAMGGSKSCTFYTFEQCQMTVAGLGGFCQPNYYARAPQARRAVKRTRPYYRY